MKKYDIVFVGLGAAGLFAAYELTKLKTLQRVLIIEKGRELKKRRCPIDNDKVKKCINCKSCSIMSGAGGAGAFSDGKYNITTAFGGDIKNYLGYEKSMELMRYVDGVNMDMGGSGCKKYSTAGSDIKAEALKYDLHLLDAEVRHLGTDKNYVILSNIIEYVGSSVDILYETEVTDIVRAGESCWQTVTEEEVYESSKVVIAAGRSGSAWASKICAGLGVSQRDNRVDIGVRFECPALIWDHITDKVYESKIIYRSPVTGCTCRTFCMNRHGYVVTENTNGIMTANGHSFDDPALASDNTNFALLVTHHFTEPFDDSNAYGQAIAKLTNALAGGVMVQRFGDLVANKRSTRKRISESFTRPTLEAAEPGNLALAIPKLTLDTIIEMIYQLDKLVPGTANFDNLLYGAEVKFYNSMADVDGNFETAHKGLFIIGDCSGTTHSLSQASAEGVYVARYLEKLFLEGTGIR
ncbi:MAG: FAD-dependent oxidoreductase [Ruminococcus sp.]|nr:FAD-dependent oxidoreductase [Ruminococcus sp.]